MLKSLSTEIIIKVISRRGTKIILWISVILLVSIEEMISVAVDIIKSKDNRDRAILIIDNCIPFEMFWLVYCFIFTFWFFMDSISVNSIMDDRTVKNNSIIIIAENKNNIIGSVMNEIISDIFIWCKFVELNMSGGKKLMFMLIDPMNIAMKASFNHLVIFIGVRNSSVALNDFEMFSIADGIILII